MQRAVHTNRPRLACSTAIPRSSPQLRAGFLEPRDVTPEISLSTEATTSSAVLSRESEQQSLSTLPESWDTASLEDQFKQHTSQSQIRSRVLRRNSRQSTRRRDRAASPRGSNIVDARSWGIRRGDYLDRDQQELLTNKYKAWERVKRIRAETASDLGEQPSHSTLAEATQLSEVELRGVLQDGPIAADLILESVKGLLSKICRNLMSRGWEYDDMYQEAQAIWLEAVLYYDPTKASLTSFGTMFVRQRLSIQMDRLTSTLDKPPIAIYDQARIARIQISLKEQFGREPTIPEIAAKLGKPAVRVASLLKHRKEIFSTETPSPMKNSNQDSPTTMGEDIEEENDLDEGVDEKLLPKLRAEMARNLEAALNQVVTSESDKQMFLLYYQLTGHERSEKPVSLKTIGATMGVSHETARNRIHAIVLKLQANEKIQHSLAPYFRSEIVDY